MTYFNYHAKAKSLVKTGHCVKAALADKHNGIGPALVLYFDNYRPMPIREHMFGEYLELLRQYGFTVDIETVDKKRQEKSPQNLVYGLLWQSMIVLKRTKISI